MNLSRAIEMCVTLAAARGALMLATLVSAGIALGLAAISTGGDLRIASG